MVTQKGKLTPAEQRRLAAARAHTEAVNRREREANFRGLTASMAITPKTITPKTAH
ncbi:hypothetical protein [uncultured Leifsonia sp.]|uniref:hypothetical protein n=1 Tax=uncultured Leifsonia sp. TaxID=340359 RepID=UPI0028D4BE11|nr:hypothetical protein [uncultured Leifsonia sp.]